MKQMIALWSMVKVHGLMVAGTGMKLDLSKIVGSRDRRGAGAFGNRKSNVGQAQANYLARTINKAHEKQIYFINHRYGAFPGLRLRTVGRGERASRPIVDRTTALWSTWMVSSLILADLGLKYVFG